MKTILFLSIALYGCYQNHRALPNSNPVAFCGSTCWNDAYCTGQGACERCLNGECAGSQPIADRSDLPRR
jgi:hypothetical protein